MGLLFAYGLIALFLAPAVILSLIPYKGHDEDQDR